MSTDLITTLSQPTQLDPNRKYPVIFAIHGRGSDEQDMLQSLITLKEDCFIVAIRGPYQQGNGYSFFPVVHFGSPEVEPFNAIVDALEALIQDADKHYPIDPKQKYLFGFSQGAILSMSLALKMGNKIRGIVALNGYIPQHVRETRSNPTLNEVFVYIFHGTEDQIFPITIGQDNAQFFTEAGAQVNYEEYAVAHDISFAEQNAYTNWFRKVFK